MKYLFEYLQKNNLSLSSCESFTGGMFASLFSDIPGASNYFKGSFICYSNDFKIEHLKINQQVIKKNSEVSKEVLELMLKNTKQILKTDVVFAFSGFATPIDVNNSRSGLSYLGFLINDKCYIYQFIIKEDISRSEYKKQAIDFVLRKFASI
ncbi:competence damage-inducible protein A [Spiroplasma gladiatoris]|uniref:Competence damage-inducible protein A n=1 Tax=Spiroplasma gladiatoris TaxID=2143 RepID=A0A4P7AJ09_9MOLU|nr:nicotinamide-nucleotide amidohydrolase family protein [Spiroplasma gladiatoris]QBQ07510.1 competence damage-inducible protein A [Spiroplasma gladiatoris]